MPPALRKALPSFDLLTPRQRQVADLLVAGKGGREIAEQLGIGCQTVKNHITCIYRRLAISPNGRNAHARVDLAMRHIDEAKDKARNAGYATGYRHGYVDGLERGRMEGRKAAIAEMMRRCSVCPLR